VDVDIPDHIMEDIRDGSASLEEGNPGRLTRWLATLQRKRGDGSITLRFLGTGTATPSLQRLSSSYLVSTSWGNVLIDAGPSVVRRLLEFGYTTADIDVILLTHFHPDHSADLTTFLFACNCGEPKRTKDLVILGGKGLELFFRRLCLVYPSLAPKGYSLSIRSMARDVWPLGQDLSIETEPMKHRKESIGVKITGKKTIVFTGDTDYSANLVSFAKGADLLVSECSFPYLKVEGHLNLAALEKVVAKTRPKQVILSHLYSEWERFRGVLHAPFLLAEDGLEITL
jgi:ribonuclease BN (tRNA processing enzyme)